MEERFVGVTVDLQLLCERLALFFRRKNLKVVRNQVDGGWGLVVNPSSGDKIVDRITVLVTGRDTDFTVKFSSGSRSRVYKWLGNLTVFLGGSILFTKGFESELALEKLEREFWAYVDQTIAALTG